MLPDAYTFHRDLIVQSTAQHRIAAIYSYRQVVKEGGLIVTGSPLTLVHRDLIITLAARHRLPAVYPFRYFATSGGLISYGPNTTDPHRRAASYIDRILKGEKPSDLPVQAPNKYELVVNLAQSRSSSCS